MTPRPSISPRRPARRAPRGAATVELAILAPILVVLVLWANYFWEVQRARIKAAELARYVAFERTVNTNAAAVAAEAQERYKDLDGATPTGDLGTAYRNRLTLTVTAQDVNAPLHGLAAVATPFVNMLQLNPSQGAVETTVQIRIEDGIIPDQIAFYGTGPQSNQLDLNFSEGFHLVHDTWRAWYPGNQPSNSYPTVEQNTHDKVRRIAYMGLGANGAMNAIGAVLSVLGLDFPFTSSYIRQSVMIRRVPERGNYYSQVPMETRTVPGDRLYARYYTDDDSFTVGNGNEPDLVKQKRGFTSVGDRGDNWPMRSYNCRGPFFQGAIKSEAPESRYSDHSPVGTLGRMSENERKTYHTYGDEACQ
ncbi:MAG TPA: pilus assembly protein [Myxococcus sp.]|nr:pilus assembly protein [Myxococcus sp.]